MTPPCAAAFGTAGADDESPDGADDPADGADDPADDPADGADDSADDPLEPAGGALDADDAPTAAGADDDPLEPVVEPELPQAVANRAMTPTAATPVMDLRNMETSPNFSAALPRVDVIGLFLALTGRCRPL